MSDTASTNHPSTSRREAYLQKLPTRADAAWAEVEGLYRRKKYGRVLRLVLDLMAASERCGATDEFLRRLRQLDQAFPQRQTLFGMSKVVERALSGSAAAAPAAAEASSGLAARPKKKARPRQSPQDAAWEEIRKMCRLDADTIRMAKELGMAPRSLTKNRPTPSQPWKAPLHIWIRELHDKRFGKRRGKELSARAVVEVQDVGEGRIGEPDLFVDDIPF